MQIQSWPSLAAARLLLGVWHWHWPVSAWRVPRRIVAGERCELVVTADGKPSHGHDAHCTLSRASCPGLRGRVQQLCAAARPHRRCVAVESIRPLRARMPSMMSIRPCHGPATANQSTAARSTPACAREFCWRASAPVSTYSARPSAAWPSCAPHRVTPVSNALQTGPSGRLAKRAPHAPVSSGGAGRPAPPHIHRASIRPIRPAIQRLSTTPSTCRPRRLNNQFTRSARSSYPHRIHTPSPDARQTPR